MRTITSARGVLALLALALAGCSDPAGPSATLTVDPTADFAAYVSKAEYESANGPAGPYAQYDLWLIIPPSQTANAGVVLPLSAPVYLRDGGRTRLASGADIRVGDQVQIWHDHLHVSHGAVQAPPGAPGYVGTQVIIVR